MDKRMQILKLHQTFRAKRDIIHITVPNDSFGKGRPASKGSGETAGQERDTSHPFSK